MYHRYPSPNLSNMLFYFKLDEPLTYLEDHYDNMSVSEVEARNFEYL